MSEVGGAYVKDEKIIQLVSETTKKLHFPYILVYKTEMSGIIGASNLSPGVWKRFLEELTSKLK